MPTIEYDEEMGLIWADDRWMTLDQAGEYAATLRDQLTDLDDAMSEMARSPHAKNCGPNPDGHYDD